MQIKEIKEIKGQAVDIMLNLCLDCQLLDYIEYELVQAYYSGYTAGTKATVKFLEGEVNE